MKIIEKLNVHVIDYTYDNDISHIVGMLSRFHRIEVRSYISVANDNWSKVTLGSHNNLSSFRINQSIALKAITKSTDSDHLVVDSFVKPINNAKIRLDIPDRASFVSYVDNRESHSISSMAYSSMFYIQPHISKYVLSGMLNGTNNMFDSLRNLPKEEVCLDSNFSDFDYYRYPNFSLFEESILDRRILRRYFNS